MVETLFDFFRKLFDASGWIPRWETGRWTSLHGWLYIVSNIIMWFSFFLIPWIILKYVKKKNSVKFKRVYYLFATFIFLMGLVLLLDGAMFWLPMYRLNTLLRMVTAVTSLFTVIYLYKLLPQVFTQRTFTELEDEIALRKAKEEELCRLNQRLLQKDAELEHQNLIMEETKRLAKVGHFEWNTVTGELVWSKNLYKIFEIDPNQKFNREQIKEYTHPDDLAMQTALNEQSVKTRNYEPYEFRILTNKGIKWLKVQGKFVGDVVFGAAIDITDLKEKELKLEEANKGLATFAYIASHDLQEPLRKIRTFINIIENGDKKFENNLPYLRKIDASAERMQSLVKDVLSLSLIPKEIPLYNTNPLDAILIAMEDLDLKIKETKAVINVSTLPDVMGNKNYLSNLFLNLINNSLKFCKRQPEINITGKKLDSMVQIEVQDNGIGMEEEYLEKIFQPFQRLHNKKQYEGSGIGLSISKKIVDLHGGKISAKSKIGEGTIFIIELKSAE